MPAYAPAQGHLAEVEAELGNIATAIALLHPLATSSDDPDYAAQLARILAEAGNAAYSRYWRQLAAARYEELVALHPKPSPTTLPSSGWVPAPIPGERCAWHE